MDTMSPEEKAAYDEYAATHEDAWLFPGDFVTEDYYEQDNPWLCSLCGDHGCEACDPDYYPPRVKCMDCGELHEFDELDAGLCDLCFDFRREDMYATCVACHAPHGSILAKSSNLCDRCGELVDRYFGTYDTSG